VDPPTPPTPPAPSPPTPPPPTNCTFIQDKGGGGADKSKHAAQSSGACCKLCIQDAVCTVAIWDGIDTCHIKHSEKNLSDHPGYMACRARPQTKHHGVGGG
jgi:hypothetical protein